MVNVFPGVIARMMVVAVGDGGAITFGILIAVAADENSAGKLVEGVRTIAGALLVLTTSTVAPAVKLTGFI
jgi:hypothetical protein